MNGQKLPINRSDNTRESPDTKYQLERSYYLERETLEKRPVDESPALSDLQHGKKARLSLPPRQESHQLKKPLEIWIKEDFLLQKIRPIPLLMHATPPDTNPELEFWNLLRNKLEEVVQVRRFNNLADAGPLVATPHFLQDYNNVRMLGSVREFNRQVLDSGRTPIIFTGAMEFAPKQGEIVFSLANYGSSEEKGISTPAWLYDLGAKISPIQKPRIPTIGFVGETQYSGRITSISSYLPLPDFIVNVMAGSPLINTILSLGMRGPLARRVRQKTIKEALRAHSLQTSFIQRDGHFFIATDEKKKRARNEYIQNMQDNAYILCVRGTENFSFRLYEVMSAGRIPVIIDTNMQLPDLGDFGKWEDFSVIVPYSQVHRIGDIIQEFHDSMSDREFTDVCRKSRAAFEYLLPHNFILNALRDKLKASNPELAISLDVLRGKFNTSNMELATATSNAGI